jgi:hypothetical protein
MAKSMCDRCWLRGRYEQSSQSFLGKLWRWHTGWCPGWKGYFKSLPEDEKQRLAELYHMSKGE